MRTWSVCDLKAEERTVSKERGDQQETEEEPRGPMGDSEGYSGGAGCTLHVFLIMKVNG